MSAEHNSISRDKLNAVRADAQKGNGALDASLRAAVFEYASARALHEPTAVALPEAVRVFVDAVVQRAVDSDVAPLKREGHSDDFIYELAVVASVAAGSARGLSVFSLLKGAP